MSEYTGRSSGNRYGNGDVLLCPVCTLKILAETENSHFEGTDICLTCGKDVETLISDALLNSPVEIEANERVEIFRKALSEINTGRVTTGVALLELLQDLDHPEATCLLASLYDQGRYVSRNQKRAMELFAKAATFGSAYAQYNLGVLHLRYQRDEEAAFDLFVKAASSQEAHPDVRDAARRGIDWVEAVNQQRSRSRQNTELQAAFAKQKESVRKRSLRGHS